MGLMTFDIIRSGWPNIVAIVALAMMPLISLSMPANLPQAQSIVEEGAGTTLMLAARTLDLE
jgi:hypothetical protein